MPIVMVCGERLVFGGEAKRGVVMSLLSHSGLDPESKLFIAFDEKNGPRIKSGVTSLPG